MRLAVPAAADPDRDKCTVVRVAAPECPSEPQCPIETAVNSARVTQEGRTFASAQCQTESEVPGRRRRARDLPPPPYSPAVPPPQPAPQPFQPVPLRRSTRCPDSGPKACCGLPSRAPLRWAVLALAAAGLCCVAAGAALAALRPQPRAHLTLLLLMIGIGVVLVSASGVAWRLSARCGLLRARRLVARLPPSYARPHHPYAAMLYPEFHYRPPPPTYQASMQDYRLRLLLLDRAAPALSPPPTYRSNTASLVRGATMAGNWCAGSEYSQPPSYRGRALPRRPSARVPPPAAPAPLAGVVIDSIGVETFHDLKFVHEELVLPPAARKQSSDEGKSNLVTIVQTGDVTVEPVIVTVSGSATIANTEPVHTTEIDILAHL